MPSKSLSDLPSTPSPTALFAQTAHSRQILTPAVSLTSALLFHSLAARGKSSRLFPTACALFTKTTGVSPPSLVPIFIFNSTFSNLFKINTYTSVCKQTVLTLFRMNTYAKTGGGGGRDLVPSKTQGHESSARQFAARGILTSLRHCFLTSPFSSGLRRRRKESDRQVPRCPQSCRRTQNPRNGIHRHARRRNISMRTARNHQRNIRMPRQRDRVRRIFRANVHL